MKIRRFIVLLFVFSFSRSVFGITVLWTGAIDSNWSTPGNWNTNTVPDMYIYDDAVVNTQTNMPIVESGQSINCDDLMLARNVSTPPATAVMTMNGGTFQLGRHFKIGQDAGTSGTFDMNDGTVNIYDTLMIAQRGTGNFNMYGGVVNVDKLLPCESATKQGTGTLNLYDGIINANVLTFYSSSTTTPLVNITQGTLVLLGDQSSAIETAKTAGFLKAYNGNGTIQYSVAGGYTTVTAIPEPATILLLGLGGLMFGKRRKQRI